MSDYFNDKRFSRELQNIADILETYYRDMVDFEFTIENEKLYLLSARRGKRTALACLKIAISMFCEGKIDINECINMVSPQALTELVDHKKLINTDELVFIGSGLPSGNNKADACGVVVFSYEDAEKMIRNNTHYILCKTEMSPEDIDIIRQNSDKIIDMVQDKIFETVKAANEIDIMYIEDMELGVTCFTCYCFMECKILEKPL